jgi:hypothetical protein
MHLSARRAGPSQAGPGGPSSPRESVTLAEAALLNPWRTGVPCSHTSKGYLGFEPAVADADPSWVEQALSRSGQLSAALTCGCALAGVTATFCAYGARVGAAP